MVVGICGGSASGKSTFSRSLLEHLSDLGPEILNQDRYFRDWLDYPSGDRERVRTSNQPRAVLWDSLIHQVRRLIGGHCVQEPVPGTAAFQRIIERRVIKPGRLLIVEGHLIFSNADLRDHMDLKIYLDVDAHERVLRRMLRDTASETTTLDQASAWYRRDVIPNFEVHTVATRKYADLVVPYETDVGAATHVIASGIRGLVAC